MPYTIRQNETGEFCIYKQDDDGNPSGDSFGCHSSEGAANEQIAALYASEQKDDGTPENEDTQPTEPIEKTVHPLARMIRSLFNRETRVPEFAIFKGINGTDYWAARYTNSFEDRQREIIRDKALGDYVDRVNAGFVPMPELWLMHIKGSRHGEAVWLGHIGRFVVAVGTFDDTPAGQHAKAYYRKQAGRITLSHGFLTPAWATKAEPDGITTYEVVNTFEITTLPPGAAVAANPYTSFEEVQKMAVSQKQIELLTEVLGEEAAARIISETEQQSKALEELGVRYKDFVDVSAEEPKTATGADLAPVFVELLKAQNDQAALHMAVAKRQDMLDTARQSAEVQLAALEARVKALEAELALQPRASQADTTVTVNPELEAVLKAKQAEEPEAFNPFPAVR